MNRLASIAGRIAASPFPVTDDMRSFVAECIEELDQLAVEIADMAKQESSGQRRVDNANNQTVAALLRGFDVPLIERVVDGPYQQRAFIVLHFQLPRFQSVSFEAERESSGVTTMLPTEFADGIPRFIVVVRSHYLNTGGSQRGNWEGINSQPSTRRSDTEEVILHEVIHCFDLHFRKPHLEKASPRGKPDYLDRSMEAMAYEGSLRSTVESWSRSGVSRDVALDRIRSLVLHESGYPETFFRSLPGRPKASQDYDAHVMKDPTRRKDTLTRYYKIVDQVYNEAPDRSMVAPLPG